MAKLIKNDVDCDVTKKRVVPRRGLEPPPTYVDQHLKLARLPIPPPGHNTCQSDYKLSFQTVHTTKTIPVALPVVDLTL